MRLGAKGKHNRWSAAVRLTNSPVGEQRQQGQMIEHRQSRDTRNRRRTRTKRPHPTSFRASIPLYVIGPDFWKIALFYISKRFFSWNKMVNDIIGKELTKGQGRTDMWLVEGRSTLQNVKECLTRPIRGGGCVQLMNDTDVRIAKEKSLHTYYVLIILRNQELKCLYITES